jgi:arylsulfatase
MRHAWAASELQTDCKKINFDKLKKYNMKKTNLTLALGLLFCFSAFSQSNEKPNVILINMDNFGWGELGCYGGGIIRGAATPRIDKMASEGIRLLNFNVEAQCTPSRAALLTGRYAIRTGNGTVPLTEAEYGLTQWEYTMAELFSDAGYATGMFGKWHLGDSKGRYPTDQGFDEWYGIPNSSDESFWADNELMKQTTHPKAHPEYVMEATRNQTPKQIEVYDLEKRASIDGELTDKTINFIERHANEKKPFFAYVPFTMTHMPVTCSKEFKGKSGNGKWGDALMQLDYYVGKILDKVSAIGIDQNTIIIFTADNAAEMTVPHQGFNGPWRGTYFTGFEGSLRVAFIMRWSGKIPAGRVSNEIVHEMDLMPTFAKVIGKDLPKDRVIDGKNQLDFFMGKKDTSDRDNVIVYLGNDIMGVKWKNWKMMSKEIDRGATDPMRTYSLPNFYNLNLDPGEKFPMQEAEQNFWVRYPMSQRLNEHLKSLQEEPPIPPGTPDPYIPNSKK